MSEHEAIPTKYNDVGFRSRLEARWAVMFDQLVQDALDRYFDEDTLQEQIDEERRDQTAL